MNEMIKNEIQNKNDRIDDDDIKKKVYIDIKNPNLY